MTVAATRSGPGRTVDGGPFRSIHGLVEETARTRPSATAVRFEGSAVSYAELDRRANRVAHALLGRGVGRGTPVGVCMDRSIELVVSLLGVLKSGAYYVPIDPSYPEPRRQFFVDDSRSLVLLTQPSLRLQGVAAAAVVIPPEAHVDGESVREVRSEDPTHPADLMYAIYTSGSTGTPKGVMVSHEGMFNHLAWMSRAYGFDAEDVVLQKTPFSFDASVWEIFLPLMVGGTLVVARPGGHRDAAYLVETINDAAVTTVQFVPSMLRAFLDAAGSDTCTGLRRVFAGGEALTPSLVSRYQRTLGAPLHNLYGPTEASIDALSWTCRRDDRRSFVPIGRPIDEMHALVLDDEMRLVPAGTTGELYLGGVGLARGYLHRPGLTAERFVPNPFADVPTRRLYRTGDLARRHPDGVVEYVGRRDCQVKVRGFRVELGEIETALGCHPDVLVAAVTTEEASDESHRLVAYVLPAPGSGSLDALHLEAHVRSLLPEHMVPSRLYAVTSFPVTTNGKLDRGRLASSPGRHQLTRKRPTGFDATDEKPIGVHPSAAELRKVTGIWAEMLGVAEVLPDDDFFDLGGDSILAMQITAAMRRAGFPTTVGSLLEGRTVRAVTDRRRRVAPQRFDQAPVTGRVPLTPIQRRFFEQPHVRPDHWNMSVVVETLAPLEPGRLQWCLDRLVHHHDQLRAAFRRSPSGPWEQWVKPPGGVVPLRSHDLSALPRSEQEQAFAALASSAQVGLSLADGKVVAAEYVRLEPTQRDRLLLVFHHVVMDGVSWRIVLEDLGTLYREGADALPDKTAAYREWATRWEGLLGQPVLRADVRYWCEDYRPQPNLPHDDRPTISTTPPTRRLVTGLDPERTGQLVRSAPAALGVTTEEILLACLFSAFAERTGDDRLHIDLEGHGREQLVDGLDVSRTVGWFTSIFPVQFDGSGAASRSALDVLPVVRRQLRAVPHRGIGYGMLRYAERGQPTGSRLAELPHPDIKFNYLGRFDRSALGGMFRLLPGRAGPDVDPRNPAGHELDVTATIADGCLSVTWELSTRRLDPETTGPLADRFMHALRGIVDKAEHSPFATVDASGVGLDPADLARLSAVLDER